MLKKNINSWIILNIAIIALIIDYMFYFINLKYNIALIISFICVILFNIYLFKKKKISLKFEWNIFDICFFIFTITKIIRKISIPNYDYDVANYHIYLQENPFIDKINFDFFAGKTVNAFLFPLGDRMFYIFRYLLGYRLGTILSYYAFVVIYYQIKDVLNIINKDKKKLNALFAFITSISISELNFFIGSYYIDVFSVVFILEIILSLLNLKNNEKIPRNEVIYICLLSGIATAIKLPNLILIFPIIIFFFISKKIHIEKKDFLFLLLFIIPIFPYTLDNFLQTGSPIFPYYNKIIKSKYYASISWKDPRFGIKNIFYGLIWPFYSGIIHIGYGDNSHYIEPMWAFGYIVSILSLIFIKDKKSDIYKITILSLILVIFWELFLEGYMRYAFIIAILFSIIISCILIKKINFFETNKLLNIILFSIISIYSIKYNCNFINSRTLENYEYIFKDRKIEKIHIDGVWGVISEDSGLTTLVREKNTPIYSLDYEANATNNLTKKMYKDKVKKNNIYILIDYKYRNKDYWLKKYGFKKIELVKIYETKDISCIDTDHPVYLYKVKYEGN